MPWHCLRTKTKRELEVSHALSRMGYENYCPMAVDSDSALGEGPSCLFPRYLFFRVLEGQQFYPIEKTPGVVKIVRFGHESDPAIINDEEIAALKSFETPAGFHELPDTGFEIGKEVLITGGLAAGYTAVVRARKADRMIVFLNQAIFKKVELELDYSDVEPVGG